MSDCCSSSSCETNIASAVCPGCGEKGQPVERITPEHLLKPERMAELGPQPYFFCRTPTCDVVYFDGTGGSIFRKPDLRVRVGLKETEPPIPVCYCFDFTQERILEEVAQRGDSEALPYITAKVKAGECRCEIENPSGRCCLGEVKKAVKAARQAAGVPA